MPDVDERDIFVALAHHYGTRRSNPERRVTVLGPDGGCWDYAWGVATDHPAAGQWHYVEGSCMLRLPDGRSCFVKAHAWVEEETEDGVIVHELTEGYEDAYEYVGLRIPTTGVVAQATAEWGDTRGSVIESMFVAGIRPLKILTLIGARDE